MSAAPVAPVVHSPELTITSPVMRQITTVSQNVPLEETSACRTGFFVRAAAATMGALPRPDSFENSPRAMPYRSAMATLLPANPPVAADPEKAPSNTSPSAAGISAAYLTRITSPPAK